MTAVKKEGKDFAAAFTGLKRILKRYKDRLFVKIDTPEYYYLESKSATYKEKPAFFGAVKTGKNYVSFHLMPVYVFPELLEGLSPGLKKRMQGKACFNFTAADDELFSELKNLTDAGLEKFRTGKSPWLDARK